MIYEELVGRIYQRLEDVKKIRVRRKEALSKIEELLREDNEFLEIMAKM